MREIGGYLELELKKGKEHYDGYGVLAVDTGRTAIYCALKDMNAKKVYLPKYMCTSIFQAVEYLGIPWELYDLDKEFMPPADLTLGQEEALLYINYFGTHNRAIIDAVLQQYPRVILDNTQAFYTAPIEKPIKKGEALYNIYSARKFFGVSDGAYVIKDGKWDLELPRDISYPHAGYLMKRIEQGAQAAYGDAQDNEKRFDRFMPKAMSLLSKRILQSIDYDEVRWRRDMNFVFLHNRLKDINELSLTHEIWAPMVYPLLVPAKGLREFLVQNKIYVPHWWKDVLTRVEEDSFEAHLSNYLIPLPIDQRYDREDMNYMADLILKYIQGENHEA